MSRRQALVLGFVIVSWIALVAILVGAPELYDAELKPLGLAGLPDVRLAFLAAITSLLVLLAIGTLQRWRWTFWLVLVAFAAGALRVPVVGLRALRVIPLDVPPWYAGFQAVIGVVQVAGRAHKTLPVSGAAEWVRRSVVLRMAGPGHRCDYSRVLASQGSEPSSGCAPRREAPTPL
jgi:hypothetical protein